MVRLATLVEHIEGHPFEHTDEDAENLSPEAGLS
jgi:hypothetical protein